MNLIRSIMGRREFLIAAGATSTSALACKKLAGAFNPLLQTGAAMAAEKPSADTKSGGRKYTHILSPLKIRNVIVKNRLFYTVSIPQYLMGPETYFSDVVRAYYANVARSAAIVTPRLQTGLPGATHKDSILDQAHMMILDHEDPAVQNYTDQMIEGIHSMGSLVVAPDSPSGETLKDIIASAKKIQDQGYDVVSMTVNTRDKDAARSSVEQMQAVQSSTNLIILSTLGGPGRSMDAEAAVETARIMEGGVDILRMGGGSAITFNQYKEKGSPDIIRLSQAIKESGVKILTMPGGGFGDPDIMEEYIAGSKCDMITLARALIADPDYGRKILEGRGEDIVPCTLENRCHGDTWTGPWISVCCVNPRMGLESAVKVIDSPTIPKKVAVIGGGPAGMKAAITAAERGHKVTLYEKTGALGGLLQHADYSPFKWPIKDFKDYLIRQVKKTGVDVHLNTEAAPDTIKAKGYDVVLVALGSDPVVPKIPGSDGSNVFDITSAHKKNKSLGKNVVFVGAGEHVVEAAIFLVKAGRNVTILTDDVELLKINRVHYPEELMNITDTLENFSFALKATTTRISDGQVFYRDAQGNERSVKADSIVIHGGLKPRQEEAMKFNGSAETAFFMIGDCTGRCGNIQKSIRSAYFMAYQV
ncbi:MAG: FAD-dependent oxidoreductase [Deltaproteobacteria bacterium]|nr:FAD-dependent oxidoreductase [Deltaproteobacteria bacterium]